MSDGRSEAHISALISLDLVLTTLAAIVSFVSLGPHFSAGLVDWASPSVAGRIFLSVP